MSDQHIVIKCITCGVEKSQHYYHKDRSKLSGYRSSCKDCVHKSNKKSYINNSTKENRRKHKLKIRYGMTLLEYEEKLKSQKGVCAICGSKPKTEFLYVDHDHRTGSLRGLLCLKCNVILGQCDDSISVLEYAIIYLKRYS